MTAIHAHRIEPLLGEWHMHDTFGLMHPAPILLREESQSVTTNAETVKWKQPKPHVRVGDSGTSLPNS